MLMNFERGSSSTPRGHVLLYFRNAAKSGDIYATYLVVLPIPIELSKYVPPMMASRLPFMDAKTISAVPLPPIPEKVESIPYLHALADARDDDLIDCGSIQANNIEMAIATVSEVAQRYAEMWAERAPSIRPVETASAGFDDSQLDVNSVLYGLMSERQRLSELAKLAGRLRYAVDGQDGSAQTEAVEEIRRLSSYLPGKYDLDKFVEAARQPGEKGAKLAQLYIERYFKLHDEKYEEVRQIDEQITSLTG